MSKGRKVPDRPIDHAAQLRERLGRVVRDTWVAWAREQANPKPHHLDSWEQLPEEIREVDRRIGQAVMDVIVKRDHRMGQISISSTFGYVTQKPYVELAMESSPAQVSPAKAREIGLWLLEAADASESDAALMAFARGSLGLDERAAAQLLDQFRTMREKQRGREVESA